ncbi:SDR family oxidoreductase [Halosquirtibacter xylanolyticus]|uniref:SDR family oxidoreductase n=1 Tax=Halosquirtibacter xylanolyticus TaxID=3374599 RepID=UPI00374A74C8|nr:SDR family oxidoreductase [Prolixibacteraceae bacterium]
MFGYKFLVTGGAGFIGSNLIDFLLSQGAAVVCLDNFATGKRENLNDASKNDRFTLYEGDIRNYEDCQKAVVGCDYVLHQAALGSVPRSIEDPMASTDVNIGGFVKMLHAAKEAGVKRFVYAASSSTYGDHPDMPKVEHKFGNALSPYAITKYVDELYARNFADLYGIECIGLRYFNVFGRRQDPNGAYAAVIPKFVSSLINHESPYINGDGSYSRDFTYIDNVVQANIKAATTPTKDIVCQMSLYANEQTIDFDASRPLSEVINIAYGERTTLNDLVVYLKEALSAYDSNILNVPTVYRETRNGDIPHSLASIKKASALIGYHPEYSVREGILEACGWYYKNLK